MSNFSNQIPIYMPNHLNKTIKRVSQYFGETIEETIYSSINDKLSGLDENTIESLNNIFRRKEVNHNAILASIQEMAAPKNEHINFWKSIMEANTINGSDEKIIKSIGNIINILEADDSTPPTSGKREAIEGDGEDPNVDDANTGEASSGPNESSNPNDQMDQANQEQNPEAQLSPDQLLQVELAQTDNKFMSLVLYDKIIELINTIDTIKDSVSSSKTEETLNLFDDLMMYKDYLDILSELIFVMDLNTVYYNFTNISLEVNNLLDQYLISSKIKILNDKESTQESKKEAISSLKDNLEDKIETDQEIQDEGIE